MSLVFARLLVLSNFGLFAIARPATQFAIHINDVCEWGRLVGPVRQRLRLTASA